MNASKNPYKDFQNLELKSLITSETQMKANKFYYQLLYI